MHNEQLPETAIASGGAEEAKAALEALLAEVRHSACPFYLRKWGAARGFAELPGCGPEDFAATPLPERRYKDEKALVKIVRGKAGPFLSEWALSDIAKEAYGARGKRPLVLFSDGHEVVEKSLWFYEHDVLPLGVDYKNAAVTAFAAHRYRIDSAVIDAEIFEPFQQEYERGWGPLHLAALTLAGSSFSPAQHESARNICPDTRFVLALPETGGFAESCAEAGALVFHASEGSIVELPEGRAVITKLHLLTTPVIRYNTGIAARRAECPCGRDAFALS